MSGYFTGIKIPLQTVHRAQSDLPLTEDDTVRWTHAQDWHATLKWHGSTPSPPDQWREFWMPITRLVRPFVLQLHKPYVFEGRTESYLCADIRPHSALHQSETIEPHVTIGRNAIPRTPAIKREMSRIAYSLRDWRTEWFTIDAIHLYESRNGHYTVIDSIELTEE